MNLIRKYNVSGPRYTSYPTVPYWDKGVPENNLWEKHIKNSFDASNDDDGIALYIHLPFCESLCTYCGCNTRITVNHQVEDIYIDAIIKEWDLYLDIFKNTPKIKEIHLGGGTPTFFSPNNLKRIIDSIFLKAKPAKNAEFSFEAHPNNTTYEHLKMLYNLGFKRLSLGIQDFDIKVQTIVNRIQPFEKVQEVVDHARELGYSSINFDLIYGLPMQTKESVVDTINKVNILKPDRIAFYSYAHVPWIKPGQRKFTEDDLPKDEAKRELYEIGKEMFSKNDYVEIGMDHFSLKSDSLYRAAERGDLHRNFMGYTHTYTQLMVGLGVSSIGDTWTMFGQNVKVVEEYYKLVNDGKLPIFRGHELTEEDLIIRKHILNCICKFETSWENDEEKFPLLDETITKLKELEKDNLIELGPNNLKIKKEARPFIRNICMCFDVRLAKEAPSTTIFSSTV